MRSLLTWMFFPVAMLSQILGSWFLYRSGADGVVALVIPALIGIMVILVVEVVHVETPEWKPGSGREVGVDFLHVFVSNIIPERVGEVFALTVTMKVGLLLGTSRPWDLWPSSWPLLAQFVLALVVGDLVFYWIHRTLHRSNTIWRLHAVHHSIRKLYMWAGARNHPAQNMPLSFLTHLPSLFLGIPPEVLLLAGAYRSILGNLQHCNVKMRLGWLNYVISTPENHRWHHTVHNNQCNYGSNIMLWDWIFGTLYVAPNDLASRHALGLPAGTQVRSTLLGHMAVPFIWSRIQPRDGGGVLASAAALPAVVETEHRQSPSPAAGSTRNL